MQGSSCDADIHGKGAMVPSSTSHLNGALEMGPVAGLDVSSCLLARPAAICAAIRSRSSSSRVLGLPPAWPPPTADPKPAAPAVPNALNIGLGRPAALPGVPASPEKPARLRR